MDHLINLANVLYLVAYFMRDIRRLRAFTILASSLLAAYFYFRPEPLMAAVYWNLFFGGLNAYHLARPTSEDSALVSNMRITFASWLRWMLSGRCRSCA
jgi:hypothetical protein